jgi:glycosyltransferase involved in cell wall biosynthesis
MMISLQRKIRNPKPKEMGAPLISVIMPILNSREKIDCALDSLIQQDCRCFEVIFSDGGSTDGTIEHALAELSNHGIKAFAIVAIGSSIYGAINHAVRTARGQWLYVLGSDDSLYTSTIFSEIKSILIDTSADVVYGDTWFEIKDGFVYGGPFWLNRLAALNICHQSIFYRARRIAELGISYDERYPIYADWNYNLKLLSCSRFHHVPLIVSRFSCSGVSSSQIDTRFEAERYQRILEYYGWRSFFLLSPDWLSRCLENQPSPINRIGLAVNRLVYKLNRQLSPSHQRQDLRHLVFAGSELPLNFPHK